MILTADELHSLTGRAKPSAQVRALERMGVAHLVNAAGLPVVTWRAVNVRLGLDDAAVAPSSDTPIWLSAPWDADGVSAIQWLDSNWDAYCMTKEFVVSSAGDPTQAGGQGFYFLCLSGEVVYVGVSDSIGFRLFQHNRAGKVFDSAFGVSAPSFVAKQMEAFYFELWRPSLNLRSERLDAALRHRLPANLR